MATFQLNDRQRLIANMIAIEGKSYQEIANSLGVSRQNIYMMAKGKRVSREIERLRSLRKKHEDRTVAEDADRVRSIRGKCLDQIEKNIESKNGAISNRAIEIFLKWIGEIDSGLTVNVNNQLSLPERIEQAKEHDNNRLKALNGN